MNTVSSSDTRVTIVTMQGPTPVSMSRFIKRDMIVTLVRIGLLTPRRVDWSWLGQVFEVINESAGCDTSDVFGEHLTAVDHGLHWCYTRY